MADAGNAARPAERKRTGHAALINKLVKCEGLRDERCIMAMRSVDRGLFVHPSLPHDVVYQDRPLPNGPTETISAPHMHAHALQLLSSKLQPGNRVLDVGSGSGYLTACFAHMVQPSGYVLGIERGADLVQTSLVSLQRCIPQWLHEGCVQVRHGNILGALTSDGTKFDAIHVGAAAATLPQQLCDLLAPGGKLVIPVGPPEGGQVLMIVERALDPEEPEQFKRTRLMDVRYVPLTPPESTSGA